MQSKKVLLAIQEKPLRDVISLHLRHSGIHVREAEDSWEAMSCIRSDNPAVVLVCEGMLGINSQSVLRMIRKTPAVVILLTANFHDDLALLTMDEGADDYVFIPFSPREVAARIKVTISAMTRIKSATVNTWREDGEKNANSFFYPAALNNGAASRS